MEKQQKISLSTAIILCMAVLIVFSFAVILVIIKNEGGVNKTRTTIEDSHQTQTIEYLENEVKNTDTDAISESNSQTNNVKYNEITEDIGYDNIFKATDVEKKDDKYVLKGVIFEKYIVSKQELEKILDEKKMIIDDTVYNLKIEDDEEELYTLSNLNKEIEYVIAKNEEGKYYLYKDAQFTDVWRMSNKYMQITVDKDIKCYQDFSEDEKITIEKEFENFKSVIPKQETEPKNAYRLVFKNGKCVELERVIYGV